MEGGIPLIPCPLLFYFLILKMSISVIGIEIVYDIVRSDCIVLQNKEKKMLIRLNIKNIRLCASCCDWDDPMRSAIRPTSWKNIWEIDTSQTQLCIKRRIKMKANASCLQYHCKIKIY